MPQKVDAPDSSGTEQKNSATDDTAQNAPHDGAGGGKDENLTDSPRTRWEWLSSLVAALIVGSFLVMFAAVAYKPAPVAWPGGPVGYAYVALVLAATTYAIGEDVVGILTELRKGSP